MKGYLFSGKNWQGAQKKPSKEYPKAYLTHCFY